MIEQQLDLFDSLPVHLPAGSLCPASATKPSYDPGRGISYQCHTCQRMVQIRTDHRIPRHYTAQEINQ